MPTAIRVYEELGSTQTEALKALNESRPGPGWIQALHQTQGVGRRGRKWESVRGNLMASWYGRLKLSHAYVGQLAFVAGLSVVDLLRDRVQLPERLRLKWPNDVLYDGHKLCGILVESASVPEKGHLGIVVGVGININGAPQLGGAYEATSVRAAMKTTALQDLDPVEWLKPLSLAFEARLEQWQATGFAPVIADWMACAHGVGGRVNFFDGATPLEGEIDGLSPEGALKLRDGMGRLHMLTTPDGITYAEASCS